MGGPGSYFESVSRNQALTNDTQVGDEAASGLEVAAVETSELAPPGTGSARVTGSPDGAVQGSEPASGNLLQSGNATATTPAERQQSGAPVQIGLYQTQTGDVLLLPRADEGTAESDETASTSAYASLPSTLEPQPPALASLAAGSDGVDDDASFVIGSEATPVIDPLEAAAQARIPFLDASISHGQCEGGFGPKPKKIGATRINPGDPYYIEIRMRQTPLLPVGHTYVAYGKLGADGEPLDERLIMLAPVGGYAGAALASGIPMPSILTPHRDDCRIRPDVGYRVSLNAQRYEKLLREVQQAKAEKPSYLLLAYNCNHFMTRIAGSVGILPPENIYLPAVQYLYAMIERNEGIRVSRF